MSVYIIPNNIIVEYNKIIDYDKIDNRIFHKNSIYDIALKNEKEMKRLCGGIPKSFIDEKNKR